MAASFPKKSISYSSDCFFNLSSHSNLESVVGLLKAYFGKLAVDLDPLASITKQYEHQGLPSLASTPLYFGVLSRPCHSNLSAQGTLYNHLYRYPHYSSGKSGLLAAVF